MVLAALKRPFSVETLPGLLVVLIPIAEFLAMGYKLACASSAMRGNYELPRWTNWKQLFLFGLCARVVQAIWLAPVAGMFVLFWFKLKSLQLLQASVSLEELLGIKNLLTLFFVLLIVVAVFAPASVLNYAAEGRFTKAFSFSMLKRLASWAYLVGWLITGIYTSAIIAIFFATLYAIGSMSLAQPIPASIIALLAEAVLFWFPGITIWSLLGEAWGKAMQEEYYGRSV